MKKICKRFSVYDDLFLKNLELCGSRTIGVTIRHSLFRLEKRIKEEGVQAFLAQIPEDLSLWGDSHLVSAHFYQEDDDRLFEIAKYFPGVRTRCIVRLALNDHLNAVENNQVESLKVRNSTASEFRGNARKREVAIEPAQYDKIVSRYSKYFISAAVRSALDFFAEGYEHPEPWAKPSTITDYDRDFFNPATDLGREHLDESYTVCMNFYENDRDDLDILEENLNLTVNSIIRVCLDRFLTVPGWGKRRIKKESHYSGTRLSTVEPSKQLSMLISTDLKAALEASSPNGKMQIPVRAAIDAYLQTSKYANKTTRNLDYRRSAHESHSLVLCKTGTHVIASKFDQLTIAATWEGVSRNQLLDTIFQDYLNSIQFKN